MKASTHDVVSVISALDDLRRHVLDGAAEGVGAPLLLLRPEFAAQPEVGQHHVTGAVQQDVLQLDVAVDYAVLQLKNSTITIVTT